MQILEAAPCVVLSHYRFYFGVGFAAHNPNGESPVIVAAFSRS